MLAEEEATVGDGPTALMGHPSQSIPIASALVDAFYVESVVGAFGSEMYVVCLSSTRVLPLHAHQTICLAR